jgi:hypothetical protein
MIALVIQNHGHVLLEPEKATGMPLGGGNTIPIFRQDLTCRSRLAGDYHWSFWILIQNDE